MGMITETPPPNSQLKDTTQCAPIPRSTLLANSRVPVYENYCGNSDEERARIKQEEMSSLKNRLTNSSWGRTSEALASTLVDYEASNFLEICTLCDKTIFLTKKNSDMPIDISDLMKVLKQSFDDAANNDLAHFCFKVLKNGTVYITFKNANSDDAIITDLLLCNPASRKEKKDNIISKYSKVNSDSLLNLYKNQKTLIQQHYLSRPA